jgi:hypothetical protein
MNKSINTSISQSNIAGIRELFVNSLDAGEVPRHEDRGFPPRMFAAVGGRLRALGSRIVPVQSSDEGYFLS